MELEDTSGLSPDAETHVGSSPTTRTIMKMHGPYKRKDGRKHLVVIYDNGSRGSISYPKWLVEEHIGRKLTDWETVDHIDGDFTNDSISNLQILSREDNARKSVVYAKKVTLVCKTCGAEFIRRDVVEQRLRNILHKDGPFCSKSCVGKLHH